LSLLSTIEGRIIVFDLAIIVFVLGLLFLVRKNKSTWKPEVRMSLIVLLSMLAPTWFIYAQERPHQPFSIILFTAMSFVMTGFMALFVFRPLTRLEPFVKCGLLEKAYRIGAIIASYALAFGFVEIAFSFVIVSMVKTESVPLAPELTRYTLPTIVGSILIVYRLGRQSQVGLLKFLCRLCEDTILASFAVFPYISSIRYVGVETLSLFGAVVPNLWHGFLVGVIGVIVEYCFHEVVSDARAIFPRTGYEDDLWKMLSLDGLLVFFEARRRGVARQQRIDEYVHGEGRLHLVKRPGLVSRLDSRFHFTLAGRVVKMSHVVTVGLVCLIPLSIYSAIPVRVRVIVPAYSVGVVISANSANLPVLLSDQVESAERVGYAVPLVRIRVLNSSLTVPLSSRYTNLNSSEFFVSRTGEYLVVKFHVVPVEYVVGQGRFLPKTYDQMNNSQFDYFPIYRDAEIYYALTQKGYHNITTVSMNSLVGMMTSNVKLIYAVKDDYRILLQIRIEGETLKSTDETVIMSTDQESINMILLNLKTARISTSMYSRIEEPPIPFLFVRSS